MSGAAILLVSLLAALLVPVSQAALKARKLIRLSDGRIVAEPSDMEKLFGPLLTGPMRRSGGRDLVLRKLEWARISFFTPETWVVANVLSGPLAFAVGLALMVVAGAGAIPLVLIPSVAGAIGVFYPRAYLGRRLRDRQKAIRRDGMAFMSLYARTATVLRDTTAVFGRMLEIAARENAERNAPQIAKIVRRDNRKRRSSPYASDLWIGLEIMMKARQTGIHRKGATYDNPDPLISFAVFVNDPDITTFIDRIRQARDQQRHISPEQVDIMVENLQNRRLEEIRRGFAALLTKATTVLVAFNMPLLLLAIGLPIVYVITSGF